MTTEFRRQSLDDGEIQAENHIFLQILFTGQVFRASYECDSEAQGGFYPSRSIVVLHTFFSMQALQQHFASKSPAFASRPRERSRRALCSASPADQQQGSKVHINVIPNNGKDEGRSQGGIPPVMGAHLMPSGAVAPISTSKGPGIDVTPHQFQVSELGKPEQCLLEGDSSSPAEKACLN